MTRSNSLIRTLEDAGMRAFLALARTGILGPMGRGLAGSGKPPPGGPHRALVVKWCCMGDAIVSLYAIREFKRRHPDTALEVLVSSRIAEVYRGSPFIEAVHVLPITGRRLALELMNPRLWLRLASLCLRLRGRRFAQMIDLELYRAHGALLKRLFGIPFSRGFLVEGSLDKGHDLQSDLPRRMAEWKCFYRVLGLEPPSRAPEPLFDRTLRSGASPRGRRIGIVHGSSFNWPQKKWPGAHYARLIALLREDGHEVVLFGTPPEAEDGRRIAEASGGPVRDTTGRLDYAGLLDEISGCDLVVGNDTGTLHLAAACGVPTVTLFGPTDPSKWNPLTSTAVFLEDMPCRPCYYLGSMPPCGHFNCLRKLQPSLVAERIRARLSAES
jgi:ADP-heptose:LPS heptosyltransferase